MPLQLGDDTAVLTGIIAVEETEPLAAWLRAHGTLRPPARVDLGGCLHLHTAVLQALLAAKVQVSVPPTDPFLQEWVAPLLAPVPIRTGGPASDDDRASTEAAVDNSGEETA